MQDRIYSRISQAGSDSLRLPSSFSVSFSCSVFPTALSLVLSCIYSSHLRANPALDNQTCTTRRVRSTIDEHFALRVRLE